MLRALYVRYCHGQTAPNSTDLPQDTKTCHCKASDVVSHIHCSVQVYSPRFFMVHGNRLDVIQADDATVGRHQA